MSDRVENGGDRVVIRLADVYNDLQDLKVDVYDDLKDIKKCVRSLEGTVSTFVETQGLRDDHATGSLSRIMVLIEKIDQQLDGHDKRIGKVERRIVAWPASAVIALGSLVLAVVYGGF